MITAHCYQTTLVNKNRASGKFERLPDADIPNYKQLRTLRIMPRAKKGTVTGDNLTQSKRGKKGGLTGSKHFDKPEVETPESPVETTKNAVGKAASAVGNGVKAAANTVGAARDIAQTVSNGARQVRRATNGGSDLVTADIKETLSKADNLASEYGLESTDLKSAMRATHTELMSQYQK